MATYKVLQDIEAEDTLIGPLTLRQCLYAAIAVIGIYLSVVVISKHAPFLVFLFLPFIIFGAFFAFPWSKQQSTEVWALAKIRFYFKPRKRIWNQTGAKELVTITAPKTVKKTYSSNLSPTEVSSRLKALADTIDSRGWAVKNVDLGYFTHSSSIGGDTSSDRLVMGSSLPQDVPNYDAAMTADIFDVQNNSIAKKFDTMMTQAADQHRQQIVQQMSTPLGQPPAGPQPLQAGPTPQPAYWHMHTITPPGQGGAPDALQTPPMPQPQGIPGSVMNTPYPYDLSLPAPVYPGGMSGTTASSAQPIVPIDYASLRQPGVQSAPLSESQISSGQSVTAPPNPAILELANNNDLNVATIAREAQARSAGPNDEVVVSLH